VSLPPNAPGVTDRGRVAALELLGQLQPVLQEQDRAAIVATIRQLVALRAPLNEQWVALSQIAAANGEATLAKEAMELYLDNGAADPTAPYKKVALLSVLGAWGEALALMRTLPETLPDPASYTYSRGTAALYVGETDEARQYLEAAVRFPQRAGTSWSSLSVLVNFAEEPDLMDRLVAIEESMETAPRDEQIAYAYALGKAHADRGEYAQAFAAVARGARMMKASGGYSRERDRFTATDAMTGYDGEAIAAIAQGQSEPTDRTIFVTGLPRSGTTLISQILTSHSAVVEGGETYRLPLLLKDIGGLSCQDVAQFVDQAGAPAAARLWSHWLDERFPAPGRVVDKSLNTSRFVGFVTTLLPEAPLIWITRDPLDCAWACFRRRFMNEAPWSCDLEDIAYHFRLEDELLAYWSDILGRRLLVVPYEELASEPEPWIRRILAHCGLPEEPQAFAPHKNARTVTTSSVMQVRRPINREGIGSAEPYREFLEPFVKAYYR
jgi:tetratricopeptide (TPR) repeat protein